MERSRGIGDERVTELSEFDHVVREVREVGAVG